jgi:parallel beta-helix repeat protein
LDTISNSSGHCISLINCSDITIQNCKLGPSKGNGINLYNCKNIKVVHCTMESVSTGVFASLCTRIEVSNNEVKNVIGPYPRGQMVQFDHVSGGGNLIANNTCENVTGQSRPEDVISLYMSDGIAESRIQVIGNRIRGGGPSTSGGGIMTGDRGGSYILVQDNILVNPGSYGITIASGHHITIRNNRIFGEMKSFSNFGLSVWNQYTTDCFADTIMNNEVNFTNKKNELSNLWNPGNCGSVYGWNTNVYNPNLKASILPEVLTGKDK